MTGARTLARPYAKAVFAHAREHGRIDAWREELAFLSALCREPTLRRLIDDRRRSRRARAEALLAVAGDRLSPEACNLVRLLGEYGRLALLPVIAEVYETLRSEAEGRLPARLQSARPLDEALLARLVARLGERLGRPLDMAGVDVDPALLAGVTLRAGDRRLDASLRARLDGLRAALLR